MRPAVCTPSEWKSTLGGPREGRDFPQRLDGPGLVIRVHDGDQGGGGTEGAPHVVHPNQAVRADGQPGHFDVFLFELHAGIEHRRMFDGTCNNVLRPARVPDNAEDGQIVGLRTAAGEHDFAGIATDPRGDPPTGAFQPLLGGLPKMVDTGRVAADLDQSCREVFQHLRRNRSGRVVVEVKMLHFLLV